MINALFRNHIEPKIEEILRKNQSGFRRNRSTASKILTIRRIQEGIRAKNYDTTILFVDFSKAFDSVHRGTMEQILLTYDFLKETVAAIMMLYKNTKVKVRSPNWDRLFRHCSSDVYWPPTRPSCLNRKCTSANNRCIKSRNIRI